jgi:hypothetical protein
MRVINSGGVMSPWQSFADSDRVKISAQSLLPERLTTHRRSAALRSV